MKRRQLLKLLRLAPPLWLAACKDKLPSTPTIVKGKIIDEKGNPLEGAGLRLSGSELKGFSGTDTFSITIESDKNGQFELYQLVPARTEQISIASRSTSKIIINNQNYEVYIYNKGNYHLEVSPYFIDRSSWGKTTILSYQFIKQ